MSTRFYLPSSGSLTVAPTIDPMWNHFWGFNRVRMSTTLTDTAFAEKSTAEPAGHVDGCRNVLIRQYVSDPLIAQSISGTFKSFIQCYTLSNCNFPFSQVVVRLVDRAGRLNLGNLYLGDPELIPGRVTSQDTWKTGSNATKSFPRSQRLPAPVTPRTIAAGSRIVVEFGYRTLHTTATDKAGVMYFGDSGLQDLDDVQQDGLLNHNPWIEFSTTLSFE